MSLQEKIIGTAKLKEEPSKKQLQFKLKNKIIKNSHLDDSSVDTRILKDKAVTPEKLSDSIQDTLVLPAISTIDTKYKNITDELYTMVRSLQVGGVALSNQFGNREDIGITQKTITKALGNLWNVLSTITGKEYMKFKLAVSPAVTYTETSVVVSITADCSEAISDFDSIKIYKDDELVAESSDINVFTTSVTIDKTSTIKAIGYILGKQLVEEAQVVVEIPFFMGGGQEYTDVINQECHKDLVGTLEGDYDLIVKNTGEHIFIIIPVSRQSEFRRADMNGLGLKVEIPMEATVTEDFVVYKSLNTYQAGTYNIDIDINS